MTCTAIQMSARRKVRDALKRGTLVRPATCSKCGSSPPLGSDGRATIHAHHHDYQRPLDVEWLCAKCHRADTPLPAKMGAPTPGERNGQAKLTAEAVIKGRLLRAAGMPFERIAKILGVAKSTARSAVTGKLWKHVAASPSAPK